MRITITAPNGRTRTRWTVETSEHWNVWNAHFPTLQEATDYAAKVASWTQHVDRRPVTYETIDSVGATAHVNALALEQWDTLHAAGRTGW